MADDYFTLLGEERFTEEYSKQFHECHQLFIDIKKRRKASSEENTKRLKILSDYLFDNSDLMSNMAWKYIKFRSEAKGWISCSDGDLYKATEKFERYSEALRLTYGNIRGYRKRRTKHILYDTLSRIMNMLFFSPINAIFGIDIRKHPFYAHAVGILLISLIVLALMNTAEDSMRTLITTYKEIMK